MNETIDILGITLEQYSYMMSLTGILTGFLLNLFVILIMAKLR